MATRATRTLALVAVVTIALSGCRSKDSLSGDPRREKTTGGGTLTYFSARVVDGTDPQRAYLGRDLSTWSRLVYRSLVTFPVSADPAISTTPVPDLATDTGTSSHGARSWTFTVKDGVTWEDGRPITCADFKYGASRVFATDVITGGPNYLLTYLDIPTDPQTGLPIYTGPYHSSAEGRAAFDRAITCNGKTITYHFKKPWADFPLAVAALHMMDPYRRDKDRRGKSDFQIFSNGPYRLEGSWDNDTGGTFVRNGYYDPSTDSTEIRKARPDRIVFDFSKTAEEINDLLIADRGEARTAVTDTRIPPAYYGRITGPVADRAVTVEAPFVDHLVPNFRRLTNLRVRRALAASLDVAAYVEASGGTKVVREATDLLHPAVRGYHPRLFPGGSGDPEKARRLLESAGVQTPYPITYMYVSTPAGDKQAAAMERGWEKGGFAVTLDARAPDEYSDLIEDPGLQADVIWDSWGADWPSAITVVAPLFDSRPNLTTTSNGQDFGAYRSVEFETLVDAAQQAADLDSETKVLQQADQVLADDVAYIPLGVAVLYLLHGSRVAGYLNTAASSSFPDLGAIGVR
ncbi:ABC transporter substrate-binding protein [Nocardioides pocheonensis]|uniref:ABC transporter substrate-binding protein n=1 Tax=Nocardioides pocheonensis TaxID=661485 RepID=A0A3N0GJW7_9ACTN|nr:ABC transporter substrate-binding protein [Nocardioides pocheonensis]RNM12408.1 ABC transporter substrate-binding protein [Nocardioides pocheonensis]